MNKPRFSLSLGVTILVASIFLYAGVNRSGRVIGDAAVTATTGQEYAGWVAQCRIWGTWDTAVASIQTKGHPQTASSASWEDISEASLVAETANTAWITVDLGEGLYRLEVLTPGAASLNWECRRVRR